MRPPCNSLSWWSILGLGVLVVVLHQILVLPLSVYEMTQRKTLPEDAITYILYVLCWPFMLASRAGFTENSVLIASWFLGSLFWASVVCLISVLYRMKRIRNVCD
jgi:hypothetical protein